MSENFTIKKDVEIDIDVQIDHICCDDCGVELDFTVNVDGFGDLQIKVCSHDCN